LDRTRRLLIYALLTTRYFPCPPTSFSNPPPNSPRLLETGQVSSVELTQAFIDRRRAVDDRVKAFNSFDETDALAQARASDARRAGGEMRGALEGIPVGLKDVIAVAGQPLTCSSRMLANFVSPYDATVAARLQERPARSSGVA